jgi:hypothetical protein
MKQLRGPKHENWPVCDPRAAPPGEYGLKSGENGHLSRANGAIDGPYCSPTWPSVFGRRYEPLAGRGGGFGGWSCTSAHTRRVGRFFHSSALGKRAVPRPSGAGVPGGYARGVWVTSTAPGRARGDKAVAFHNPQAFSNVQEETRSCARGQVVIARPPVLTPPWRYRRSLVSKERFAISTNVVCVGIR